SVLVGGVLAFLAAAERGNLDRLRSREDMHQAEAPADDERAAEERLHFFRRGVGRDVEILGLKAEEQIAHGTAHDGRLETGLLELARDVERAARDLVAANPVRIRTVNARGGDGPARDQARKEATNQLFRSREPARAHPGDSRPFT